MRSPKGRLELTWMGKDMALIPTALGTYDYEWVDPADPRACEVKSIEVVNTVGETTGATGVDENLLIALRHRPTPQFHPTNRKPSSRCCGR